MADNNSYRSNRQNAPFAPLEPSAEAPGSAGTQNDPLAELARLIGQNDPFADFGRGPLPPLPKQAEAPAPSWGAGTAAPSAYANPPAEQAPPVADHSQADPYAVDPYRQSFDPYPSVDPYQPVTEPYQAAPPAPGYTPVGSEPRSESPPYDRESYDSQNYGDQNADTGVAFQPPAFDPEPSAAMTAAAPEYEPDPYFRGDPNMRAPGDDHYDDAPAEERRSPIAVAVAVVGLVIVGTAGAYAYRTYFGEADVAKPPPVIRADAGPSKVVPPKQASSQPSGKLINDRIGDPDKGERVVSREEQPVEIKSAPPSAPPRVVFPGPVPNLTPGGTSARIDTPPPSRPSSVLGEPKRVRTVVIRPDQPAISAAPQPAPVAVPQPPRDDAAATAAPVPPPAAPPPAPARVASAPPVSVELPPTAPRNAAPRQVRRAPQPIAPPPARAGGAPLSLTPQAAPVARAPAPSQTRTALAPSAPAQSGGYNVQVSSRRSEAEARSSFQTLRARYPSQLGGHSPIIRRVNLGARGIYYRAMVGPFPSAEQASSLCSSLRAAGGQCLVQRN